MTTAVVVGSGPNGLAAAVTLASAGVDVRLLEAADAVGGGLRSGELTIPGLVHDECAAFHPFATDSAFSRFADLAGAGVRWRWADYEFAHPLDGGVGAALRRSVDATAAALGADGPAWARLFGRLTERFDAVSDEFLRPVLHLPRHPLQLGRFGVYAAQPATLLARRWRTEQARALFGGVAAHAYNPLHLPLSAAVGVALTTAAHAYGWPVAEGGSASIASALSARLAALGGTVETGCAVDSLDALGSPDLVLLDTTPAAAARIIGDRLPTRVRRAYQRYRHGPGAFKVDFAVAGSVPWTYEPARRAGTLHLGGTLAETTASEAAIQVGRMPERPFVLVGQQWLADPTRARGEAKPLYAYAHVPHGFTGDVTQAIIARIEQYAPGFRDRILATHVRTTTDLSVHNRNYVGGDIATGAVGMRQLVFRPRLAVSPYRTGVPGVYLCSAATPPGAGAHGMCGYLAAQSALRARARKPLS